MPYANRTLGKHLWESTVITIVLKSNNDPAGSLSELGLALHTQFND